MYCEELDRLLELHSALTLEYYRQDVRTQQWFASREEWLRECQKLQAAEQEMDRVAADVVDHHRRHRCGTAAPLGMTPVETVDREVTQV